MRPCVPLKILIGFVLAAAAAFPTVAQHGKIPRMDEEARREAAKVFILAAETGHNAEAWRKHGALSANLKIDIKDDLAFDGRLIYEIATGRARLESSAGTVLIRDGDSIWLSPALPRGEFPVPRYHIRSLLRLLAMPFEMEPEDSYIEARGLLEIQGRRYRAALQRFTDKSSEAADDWSLIFLNRLTGTVDATVYYARRTAEEDPVWERARAVTFEDFQETEGVVLAHRWTFWPWSRARGIDGESIGTARLSDLEFIEPEPEAFDPPCGAREIPPVIARQREEVGEDAEDEGAGEADPGPRTPVRG